MTRAAVLAAILLVPLAAAQDPEYGRALEEGVELFTKGEHEEALKRFAQARVLAPTDWRGPFWQAVTRLEQAQGEKNAVRRKGMLDEAEAMSSVLVKDAGLDFRDPLRLYLLGTVRALRGEVGRALPDLKSAQAARPEQMEPYAEVGLLDRARYAYALACWQIGRQHVLNGDIKEADPLLEEARRVYELLELKQEPLYRTLASVAESLGRDDEAVRHLRTCIELREGDAGKHELSASLAVLLMRQEKMEEAGKVLEGLPEESREPAVLVARCLYVSRNAVRAGTAEAMDGAIAYYRKAMDVHPDPGNLYDLVEDYGRLVLMRFATAEVDRGLLEDLVERVKREIRLRSECASLYRLVAEALKLLGNEEAALAYTRLYERKKQEWDKSPRFDERGRPRCRAG